MPPDSNSGRQNDARRDARALSDLNVFADVRCRMNQRPRSQRVSIEFDHSRHDLPPQRITAESSDVLAVHASAFRDDGGVGNRTQHMKTAVLAWWKTIIEKTVECSLPTFAAQILDIGVYFPPMAPGPDHVELRRQAHTTTPRLRVP